MDNELKVRAISSPWWSGVEFQIRCGEATADRIVLTKREPDVCTEPTFRLSRESSQLLMDDLWASGIRPTEGTGSAGSLAATQRHLEDMRTLVFKK